MMNMTANTKQVIVMRRDLKMRRGKEISQGGHGVLAFITRKMRNEYLNIFQKLLAYFGIYIIILNKVEQDWINSSFKKVTVRVNSEQELLDLLDKAALFGIKANLVEDSGFTEFDGVVTKTCVVLGPAYDDYVDQLTSKLELY